MQSGRARTKKWMLEFERSAAKKPDPLMGWAGSDDTQSQVRLSFDTREQAEDYARREGLAYEVVEPRQAKPKIQAYSDNFV